MNFKQLPKEAIEGRKICKNGTIKVKHFGCWFLGIGRVSIFRFESDLNGKKVGFLPQVSGFWVQVYPSLHVESNNKRVILTHEILFFKQFP